MARRYHAARAEACEFDDDLFIPTLIQHKAGTYVYDRDGHLRLYIKRDQSTDSIVHDIRQLLS